MVEEPAARRVRLEDRREKMSAAYDRAMLTLSAGAFSVSLLFYERIAPSPVEGSKWLLVAAWACFGACILVVVLSFYLSEWAHRLELDQMDRNEEADFRWEGWMAWTNGLSGVVFALGVVSLLAFASVNLFRENPGQGGEEVVERERTISQGGREQKGLNPRPPKQPQQGGGGSGSGGGGGGQQPGQAGGGQQQGTGQR